MVSAYHQVEAAKHYASYFTATFINISVDSLYGTWKADQTSMEISLPLGLRYEINDSGSEYHQKLASLRLPFASAKIYLVAAGSQTWLEAAHFDADFGVNIYFSPTGWIDKAKTQAEFIRAQSISTGRADHMFDAFRRDGMSLGDHSMKGLVYTGLTDLEIPGRVSHKDGLYLPQPQLSNYGLHKMMRLAARPSSYAMKHTTKSHRWSELSDLSESEGDEGISEADRDARLA
jgi:hypothetical protein